MRHAYDAAREPCGDGIEAIRDDHGCPRHGKFQRHRSRRRQRHIRGGEGVETNIGVADLHPVLRQRPAPHSGGDAVLKRSNGGQDEANIVIPPCHDCRRLTEYRQKPLRFAAAASGEKAHQGRIRIDTESRPQRRAVTRTRATLQNRVADEGARQPLGRENGRFERQQRQQMVEEARDLTGTMSLPCPHLRRHIVHNGNSMIMHPLGDTKAETG